MTLLYQELTSSILHFAYRVHSTSRSKNQNNAIATKTRKNQDAQRVNL
jgi:hypothetical protein